MSMEYEEYERQCAIVKKENETYLEAFRVSLEAAELSKNTIRKHCENVDFFLNDFMLRYEPCRMPDGCFMINSFLGDFFIRKCMWSTPATIRSTAASLKKFYKYMLAEGEIGIDAYAFVVETIKEEMDEWVDNCESFNNIYSDW